VTRIARSAPFPTRLAGTLRRLGGRLLVVATGIAVIAFGIVCVVRARLGADPLTVLLQGVSRASGLTLGQATQFVFGVLLVVSYLMGRERPGVATVASVLLEGPLIDLFDALLAPPAPQLAVRAGALGLGTVSLAFGIALYVTPGLGAGPPEGLMFAVQSRLALSLRQAKVLVDALALGVGWLLGGRVGVGTALLVVVVGPLVHLFYARLRAALPSLAGPGN
jgi:uncharacterized membrane protein YczE